MPCRHKFHDELTLENLTYKPETLIIGTFNPAWPEENQAEWFYGRTHNKYGRQNNNFWDVLPRLYGKSSLINDAPVVWKKFCSDNGIAITDLITSVDDANKDVINHKKWLKSYSDKSIATKFHMHTPCKILTILASHQSIRNVYLTRGVSEDFWNKLWSPVVDYCKKNDIYTQTLLTPSRYAFYQQGRHNKDNPNNQISLLSDFILNNWRSRWHF